MLQTAGGGVGVVATGGVSETYTVNVDCLLSQQYTENFNRPLNLLCIVDYKTDYINRD